MSPEGGAPPSSGPQPSLLPSFHKYPLSLACALTAPREKLSLSHRGSVTLSWWEQSGEPAPRCLLAPALVLASAQCRLEQAPCRQVEGEGGGGGAVWTNPEAANAPGWLPMALLLPISKGLSLCRKRERLEKERGRRGEETAKQASEQDAIIPSPEARRRAGRWTHPLLERGRPLIRGLGAGCHLSPLLC